GSGGIIDRTSPESLLVSPRSPVTLWIAQQTVSNSHLIEYAPDAARYVRSDASGGAAARGRCRNGGVP
ncbi:hypothetical protein, partial [Pseudonocardia nigra]|uniref:hypothetical protein n=1 Tax=Pseudonocardia nigra TaxID=1921578 RepID=UPI001C5E2838